MEDVRHTLKEAAMTFLILGAAFCLCLLMQNLFRTRTLIPAVFVLAVFLVSFFTQRYLFGIVASLVSVLALNFAFTFPYFTLNFTVPESIFSAVIMLAVTIMTSTMTTKLKKQEKMRAESEKEKLRANLLRAVSHDLRTPLTTIYGSCSAIIENYDRFSEGQKKKLLGEIREEADWLIRMVENLLSVTRIGGRGVSVVKTPTVLEELIDTVVMKFAKRYPSQEIQVEIPEEFVSIPMDAMLIGQVLTNLLENAVRHAEGMTALVLTVRTEGNEAVFTVADDGCGIPQDKLAGIFSGSAGGSPDSRKNNMGIGLSVCAAIIRAHGGRIWAKNRKEGGALFGFSLEAEEAFNGEQQI